ncbi:MAG TPA: Ig-like domain-containing protein [Saprospiraceae bacterium]|nr:Ig-like domain-containing protein [Saprospiraceae bacterium]
MKNLIKNLFLSAFMSIMAIAAYAQTGLIGIEVETYYISTATDQTAHGVPVGSKTYRVYANMAAGFGLQSVYGETHPDGEIDSLVFFSTQNFWNAPDGGNLANEIPNSILALDANIIDSWLTFGSGGGSRRGILKTVDTDSGVATTLTNSGGAMGSPLTTHDGRFNTGNALVAATAGADMTMAPFDALYNATIGNRWSTATALGGFSLNASGGSATGPIAGNNRVLIGQFTTDGEFGYFLNIQIGNGTVVEQWVAETPRPGQFSMPSLKLAPNTAPTVAITTPASNVSVTAGTVVNIEATASDTAPGTISQVEFFNGATSLAVDNTAPYQYALTATTTATITAVATDNEGATTTSAPRIITVTADPAPVVTLFTASPVSPVVMGTTVTLNATATDNGNVVSAQFKDGATNIGAAIPGAGPFSTSWTAMPVGAHTLAVVVTDNLGNTSSQTLAFTVSADPAPVVTSFTAAPASPQAAGTSVTLNATATDNGTVVSGQFTVNGTNLGASIAGAGPFSTTWAANIAGTQTLAIIVTDNAGNTSSQTLSYVVTGPSVTTFTTTPATSAIAGTVVTLNATASASAVSAQFLDGTTSIFTDNSAPFSTTWTAAVAGAHILAVVVTDAFGNTSSQTLTFTVLGDPVPVVTFPTITSVVSGTVITLNASATDNGTVTGAQFKVNGVNQGPALTGVGPFSTSWTPTLDGSYTVSVEVTDNVPGNIGVASQTVVILPSDAYEVRKDTALCNEPNICVPIQSLQGVSNVIGYDLVLSYNENKVIPTGVIRKFSDLAPSNLFETTFSIKNTPTTTGEMLISVFFNSNAPLSQRFSGPANSDLICVEFLKKPAYAANELVLFNIDTLEESYISGVVPRAVRGNGFLTYRDSTLNSKLEFWADNSALGQDDVLPFTGPVTNIFGANASCVKALNPVNPNANGEFTHFLNDNELNLNIERDIQGGSALAVGDASVQSVINGFDAFLVRRVLLDDASFVPSIYQMIAMDVNMDGQVSAGDASQINQRSVLQIAEFRQKWNYTNAGVSNGTLSKDWLFVNELTILNDADGRYSVSSIYPAWDFAGYNKDHVPTLAFCMPTPVSDWARCAIIGEDKYLGILLGDANGNFQNLVAGVTDVNLRTNKKVVFDINNAVYNVDNTVDVPVSMVSSDDVNSIDFAMSFDNSKLEFNKVVSHRSDVQTYAFVNPIDESLRLTSNGTSSFVNNAKTVSVRFNLVYGKKLSAEDFVSTEAYLNGDLVKLEVRDRNLVSETSENFSVYPNPVSNILNINVGQDAKAQLFDVNGKAISNEIEVLANMNNEMSVLNLASGIYTLKVYNATFVSTKKVIVTK